MSPSTMICLFAFILLPATSIRWQFSFYNSCQLSLPTPSATWPAVQDLRLPVLLFRFISHLFL